MRLIKYQHACFVIELDDSCLVVDPGQLAQDFVVPETNVVGVVVTHIHGDHLDQDKLRAIQSSHPDAAIYAHQQVIDELDDDIANIYAVNTGDVVTIDGFTLEFSGAEHALIHPKVPMCANLCVRINDTVYYPGDSLIKPDRPIKVLALPIAAPWMKTAEGMDYLVDVKPEIAFPTHDGVLSDAGKMFTDAWMQRAAEEAGCHYRRLDSTPFVIK